MNATTEPIAPAFTARCPKCGESYAAFGEVDTSLPTHCSPGCWCFRCWCLTPIADMPKKREDAKP